MIVIDDEEYVVNGMKRFIEWSSLGVEIIDSACNGSEGFEKACSLNPDIIITDIKMPEIDGIEMVKKIRDRKLKAKVVFLTGYNDFEYVREGMKYGVIDYILKPSMPDEIKTTMQKVVDICDEEKQKEEYEKLLQEKVEEGAPILIGKFLGDLFEGKYQREEGLVNKALSLELDFSNKVFCVVTLHIDFYGELVNKYSEEIRQSIKNSIMAKACECFNCKKSYLDFKLLNAHLLLLVDMKEYGEEYSWYDSIKKKAMKLIDECKQEFDVVLTLGVGESAFSAKEIKKSYQESRESLKYNVVYGTGKVIVYKEILKNTLSIPKLQLLELNGISEALKLRNQELLQNNLLDVFSSMKAAGSTHIDYMKLSVMELLGIVFVTLSQMGEKKEALFFASESTPWEAINKMETVNEIIEWLKVFFQDVCRVVDQKNTQKNIRVVEKVIEYVKKNYFNDFSLNDLSKELFFTPNYLSFIFSQNVGENFIEYLTKYRIERAKELLTDGKYKVYEVGEMVGYRNIDYFRRIFKEYVGVSPSEFKK